MGGYIGGARVENLGTIRDSSQIHSKLEEHLIFHLVCIKCREATVRVLHCSEPLIALLDLFLVAIAEL